MLCCSVREVSQCYVVKPVREVSQCYVVKPVREVSQCYVVKPVREVSQCYVVKPVREVSQCYVVKPVREVPEREYLEDLMSEIIELAKLGRHSGLPCIPKREPNLEKPSKEEVIQFQRTRFPVNSSHKP